MKSFIILQSVLLVFLFSACNDVSFEDEIPYKENAITRTVPNPFEDKGDLMHDKDSLWRGMEPKGPEIDIWEFGGNHGKVYGGNSFCRHIIRKVPLSWKDGIGTGILYTDLDIDDSNVNIVSENNNSNALVENLGLSCEKGIITFKLNGYVSKKQIIKYESKSNLFFHEGNNYMCAKMKYIIEIEFEGMCPLKIDLTKL